MIGHIGATTTMTTLEELRAECSRTHQAWAEACRRLKEAEDELLKPYLDAMEKLHQSMNSKFERG